MECINKDAKYIQINTWERNYLIDVNDIYVINPIGEQMVDRKHKVMIYQINFMDGTAWQVPLDKEVLDRFNELKNGKEGNENEELNKQN